MPFGLSNAPSTFQALMNSIFCPMLRKFVLVLFDDILIYSPSWDTHVSHLETVLSIFQHHSLFAKLSKCAFGCEEIGYLGHQISTSGVAVDPEKIQSILDWPLPKNVKGLKGFLGITGYYRRFVAKYSSFVAPLTQLLRKNAFVWIDKATLAFQQLKVAFITTPVLALPQFEKPFIVQTDASSLGVGVVLT